MEITKEQIQRLSDAVEALSKETLIDDDVSGGYQLEPFDEAYTEIYSVINECERGNNMSISLENWIRNKLNENEEMQDYAVATDTIRCWIDEYNKFNR